MLLRRLLVLLFFLSVVQAFKPAEVTGITAETTDSPYHETSYKVNVNLYDDDIKSHKWIANFDCGALEGEGMNYGLNDRIAEFTYVWEHKPGQVSRRGYSACSHEGSQFHAGAFELVINFTSGRQVSCLYLFGTNERTEPCRDTIKLPDGFEFPSVDLPTPTPFPNLPAVNLPTPDFPSIALPSLSAGVGTPTPVLPSVNAPSVGVQGQTSPTAFPRTTSKPPRPLDDGESILGDLNPSRVADWVKSSPGTEAVLEGEFFPSIPLELPVPKEVKSKTGLNEVGVEASEKTAGKVSVKHVERLPAGVEKGFETAVGTPEALRRVFVDITPSFSPGIVRQGRLSFDVKALEGDGLPLPERFKARVFRLEVKGKGMAWAELQARQDGARVEAVTPGFSLFALVLEEAKGDGEVAWLAAAIVLLVLLAWLAARMLGLTRVKRVD